ncbi:Fe(3+) dicitrate transport protein FecA [Achromobacter ruhlandii]|uniref:TonB-dependent receptor family protein n=1 Tax=Achromobacter ruhlandii TaxID=72557 RepID=UPI00146991DC|nr:TonB-dependent receptor [Achromobacter ruhlandii]CAB3700135.1 Fe(3+) dicitrate transport protein FecA [Achromobacter ruhlandii]
MKYCLSRNSFSPTPLVLAIAAAYACVPAVYAKEGAAEKTLATIQVIGSEENLSTLGGAGQILGKKELEDSHVFTVNEALRKVPGVHARDEEGFGLRPNIAMRGLNPTRSTKITLLEDGLPLAYAPYGDNASYYHPMVDRYERIEVLKGASSLMFGPQTVGGVVNYITPAPRQSFGGYVQGVVGNRDYFNGKVNVGGGGFTVDYGHKEGDGARDNMNHKLDDLNIKYGAILSERHAITLRGNFYKEDSMLTYSGLTQAEFDRLEARYNPFKNDRFEAERVGLSATHDFLISDKSTLTTSVYYSKFDRDWWRQASNSQDAQCAALNPSRLAGVAIDPDTCNSTQGRLRSYETWGIEPRLTVAHGLGEFQAGVRAHFEEQNRIQINGTSPTARTGTLAENNHRQTSAYSGFVANRFDIGQFSVTPIARYESIKAERTNRLTGQSGENSVHTFTPGIGATWNPMPTLTVFTSLHKGFAPPRVEDLIGGTGTVVDVDYEKSLNFEFGVRAQPLSGVSVQAAYFRNDYDNLIAVGSIAGGSTPLSQGKALFEGLELAANAEFSNGVFGRMAYTWLPTAEQTEAFRNVASGAIVGAQGKRQAYAPEHTLTAAVGYGVGPFRGEIEAQYVGSQYSDFANTVLPTADGQKGEIAAYTVWNTALNYRFDKALSAFVTGKNLFDKTYIVDRTRGIQVGMPRLIQVGVKYAF